MERFTGRITAEDGTVTDGIEGTYSERPPTRNALGDWSGTFSLPSGTIILPGAFRIDLDDGRSAKIVVSRTSLDPAGSIAFKGNGPPPA